MCPNQLILSLENIRCPKFGKGAGGSAEDGTMSQLWDFLFFYCFPKMVTQFTIGPSGVRALPLGVAAKQSVHYICDYLFLFFCSPPHTFLREGAIVGF